MHTLVPEELGMAGGWRLLVALALLAGVWAQPALASEHEFCLAADEGALAVCGRPESLDLDPPAAPAPAARMEVVARGALAAPAVAPARRVSLVLPVRYQSQMREAPPAGWNEEWTPYCGAASSIMVMREIDARLVPPDKLAHTFRIGRAGNTTNDPGLDPDGIAHLMQAYGGEGRIHVHRSAGAWLDDVVGRLNNGVAVVALTLAGDHAVTVYGYEAVAGGEVTALYVADPLSEHMGPVSIDGWFGSWLWMGARFAAAGPSWQGAYVFVTYRDFR